MLRRAGADTLDRGQLFDRRCDDFGQSAELADQRLGDGFGVDSRKALEENQLQQFVIVKSLGAAPGELIAQAVAMIMEMRFGFFGLGRLLRGYF